MIQVLDERRLIFVVRDATQDLFFIATDAKKLHDISSMLHGMRSTMRYRTLSTTWKVTATPPPSLTLTLPLTYFLSGCLCVRVTSLSRFSEL